MKTLHGLVFQVAGERFLVLINDMLASGEIPDLYNDDELETIMTCLKNEVKGLGLVDSRENCWKFFIERVRRQLKVSVFLLNWFEFKVFWM
jgi:dynein heavy chain